MLLFNYNFTHHLVYYGRLHGRNGGSETCRQRQGAGCAVGMVIMSGSEAVTKGASLLYYAVFLMSGSVALRVKRISLCIKNEILFEKQSSSASFKNIFVLLNEIILIIN